MPWTGVFALALALGAQASPSAAAGAVSVHESQVYYDVSGITTQEIAAQIRRDGPGETYGPIVAGNTEVDIQWLLDMRRSRSTCELTAIQVEVEVVTTLPRWMDAARAPRAVRERWAGFIARLETHEARHREIGLETAERVRTAALAVAAQAECAGLKTAIRAAIVEQTREGARRNRAFDADTRHGLDAGTGLDPPRRSR